MARIRTIKPEFPQSESMGRVSRAARLLFIMLWPICDDHGRSRASSRMLASLLFPYDSDAPALLDGWLAELEREGCIRRYQVSGSTYLFVCNWLNHQKIDKPSKPQFPEPPESFETIREDSRGLGEPSPLEGKGKERKGEEGKGVEGAEAPTKRATRLPADWKLPPDWKLWALETRPDIDPVAEAERFADYWHGIGGQKGTKLDWQGTWRNWVRGANAPRGVVNKQSALEQRNRAVAEQWLEDQNGTV